MSLIKACTSCRYTAPPPLDQKAVSCKLSSTVHLLYLNGNTPAPFSNVIAFSVFFFLSLCSHFNDCKNSRKWWLPGLNGSLIITDERLNTPTHPKKKKLSSQGEGAADGERLCDMSEQVWMKLLPKMETSLIVFISCPDFVSSSPPHIFYKSHYFIFFWHHFKI